ncbi:MAG TPA: NADH-quinone oxidoreductase subunit NuoK [Planctomycetota bacterium]|nr:NADH-quinone oxidoreductase subunit NuoK [Planctomycetota bacterium]
MTRAGVEAVFALAGILLAAGMAGLVARRNILFALVAVEVMLNAAGLAFVAAGARWGRPEGQAMFLLILAVAGAELSVALALVLRLYREFRTLDADAASQMRG